MRAFDAEGAGIAEAALLARMAQTIAELSDAARQRLESGQAPDRAMQRSAARVSELREIITGQTGNARVQVSATIADMFRKGGTNLRADLGRLADVDFFGFERHIEPRSAAEEIGFIPPQLPGMETPAALMQTRQRIGATFGLARTRLDYLSSGAARARAGAQPGLIALSLGMAFLARSFARRRILSRLQQVAGHITAPARGDHARKIDVTGHDDIGGWTRIACAAAAGGRTARRASPGPRPDRLQLGRTVAGDDE